MPHVALATPAVRMVVIVERDYRPELNIHHEPIGITYKAMPIVAVRSILGEDGHCQDELLALDYVWLWPLGELESKPQNVLQLVVCHWPPDQDADRLAPIIAEMRRCAEEG